MAEIPRSEWENAFRAEHGYYPDEDPDLLSQGLTPDQAREAHIKAKIWGEDFAEAYGRPPTVYERRHDQPMWIERNYWGEPVITGGFGGYPPERVEALNEYWNKMGGTLRGRAKRQWEQMYGNSPGESMMPVFRLGTRSRRQVPPPPGYSNYYSGMPEYSY